MDAAELLRQAQSSVNKAREAKSFRRESSHESDDHSPRIAHTLTACCRCRQVRAIFLNAESRTDTDIGIREKQDVILTFLVVFLVSELALNASISTLQRGRKYREHMSYGYKTKYAL